MQKETYIWGAGHYGVLTARDLENKGTKIKGFIDTNANRIKTKLGLPVLKPNEALSDKNQNYQVIIAIQNQNAIKKITKTLLSFGLQKDSDFKVSDLISRELEFEEIKNENLNFIVKKYCLYCGSDLSKNKTLKIRSDVFLDETYLVSICECGLGTTQIDNQTKSHSVNHKTYDRLEKRVDIYFHEQRAHMRMRYIEICNFIKQNNPPGKKIMEIGSNIGYALNFFRKEGFEVAGCEINDKCRELSKQLYSLNVEKDFFQLQGKYDIVICCDVLEHFSDPIVVLNKIHDLLNHNGLLFIQLPNIGSKTYKKLKEKWGLWCVPDHFFHFTPSTLSGLLKKQGFATEWVRTVSLFRENLIYKIIKPESLKNFIIRVINSMLPSLSAFKSFNGVGEGDFIQIIARKEDLPTTGSSE